MNEKIKLKEIPDKNISGKIVMLELAESIIDAINESRDYGARVEFWVERETIDEMYEAVKDKIDDYNKKEDIQRGEKLLDRINEWENELSKKCHAMWNSTHGIGYLDGYTVEREKLVERDWVMATLSRAFASYSKPPVHDFGINIIEAFGEYVDPDLGKELLGDRNLFDDINNYLEVDQRGAFGFSYMFSDIIREANDLYQSADDSMYYEWLEAEKDGAEVKELYDKIYSDLPDNLTDQLDDFLSKTEGAREVVYAQADYLVDNLEINPDDVPVEIPPTLFDFAD